MRKPKVLDSGISLFLLSQVKGLNQSLSLAKVSFLLSQVKGLNQTQGLSELIRNISQLTQSHGSSNS